MAGITRKQAKVFGSALAALNNIAEFGSLKAGSPAYSLDLDAIQSAAWLQAWAGAVVIVGGNPNVPPLQDMNAVFYALTTQIAYLLERGLPEYNATTTYNLYDFCRVDGVVYQSRIDANTGNAPGASPTQWASVNLACSVGNTSQNVAVDGTGYKVDFDTESFDTDAAFNSGTNLFTAPVAGIYSVSAYLQVDNDDADPATIEIALRIVKNGAAVVQASGTSVANPPGLRWYPAVQGLVQLAAGDTLEVQFSANDMPGSGHVDISNGNLSIHRARAV